MSVTKQEFVAAATEAARESSARSGLPAGITVAQAALESGWGASGLSRQAHNYFGLKAHGPHQWLELPTREVVQGKEVQVRARFAKYGSMRECFACRDAIISGSSRYSEAKRAAGDPEQFARLLAKHWATDPQYAEKLLRIYRANGLDKLDEKERR